MAPSLQPRRGFDADAFAKQMQRAADKGTADTLDGPGEELRATLSDMHARLRAGVDQPRQAEARRPPPGADPAAPARRRAVP